uniref:Myosin_tail_1 domain-containing protein n=1 Tax=Steinernema glaseri TaxID=37863 RepID=A0A1I8A7D9_9BILA
MNKKKDAELAKLRRDIEEAHMNHENQLAALKKKSNDSVAELSDQIDQVQKMKAKVDKEKNAL